MHGEEQQQVKGLMSIARAGEAGSKQWLQGSKARLELSAVHKRWHSAKFGGMLL